MDRMSREECLRYLSEKKKKAAALLSERQSIDGGDVILSHGSSDQQQPKPLVPDEVVDVGQGRRRRDVDGSKHKPGEVRGQVENV